MSIQENLEKFLSEIPEHVKLVAVSKTKPVELIREAYETGHRIFGENKAQELADKRTKLPEDIEWHFIGHLQRNKVKYIAPFVSLIHAVDSLKLLKEINKQAAAHNRVIDCLLQFHIATESTKFGLNEEEAFELLASEEYAAMKNISITGVMGMATFTDDMELVRAEFSMLKNTFEKLKATYFSDKASFKEISMGMSNDYQVAIEEGSTIIRIGTKIFGKRETTH
jgi:pyridoxal phosphate enzyme (YggS family)